MSLANDFLERPQVLSTASKYTVANGVFYIANGAALIAWPGILQAIFGEPAFVGNEAAIIRLVGFLLGIVGWFYLFGGRSGARNFVAASVVDRLVFVPAVLVPLAMAGVFPRLLLTFTVLDPLLAIGAWVLLSRKT